MANSEVAKIREKIACEYQAAKNVFTGFTPNARHAYLIKRQENIAGYFNDLQQHMSPDEAMLMMMQVDNEVHALPSSGGAL